MNPDMGNRPSNRILIAFVSAAAAFALLAGCGSDDSDESGSETEAPTESGTETAGDSGSGPEDLGPEPVVEVDSAAEPPAELQIEDLVVGEGTEAGSEDTVVVHYVGVSWSDGEEFDSSWDRGEPATFPLTGVVPGFQQGITGMKEGGTRRITMPPELAYGDRPPPGSGIAPGETLVFVVELVEVA